ncbi:MAG: RagB/SusD family nutrient uptake outer membrane protein, partial [Bacteroidales bacterium]|nr:RagB/SusD family nutrient uptake outer membrane protein [Bacteroidales bacterium]
VTTDDILDERRIELFCENSRMFDLVRLKSEFSHPRFSAPIQVTDSRLYVEFPQRELDINPNF